MIKTSCAAPFHAHVVSSARTATRLTLPLVPYFKYMHVITRRHVEREGGNMGRGWEWEGEQPFPDHCCCCCWSPAPDSACMHGRVHTHSF